MPSSHRVVAPTKVQTGEWGRGGGSPLAGPAVVRDSTGKVMVVSAAPVAMKEKIVVRFEFLRNEKGTRAFEAGEVIFNEGEPGDAMYAVVEGEIEIRKQGRTVDTVVAGGVFGEMALIDQAPRSASAVARTACRVAPLSQQRFVFLVQETPFFALDIMRILTDRLRRNTSA